MQEYYSESVQVLGILFSVVLLVSVFLLVRARRIREKYSLVWFFIGLFIFAISVFRGFIEAFSSFLGIYYAPSAFFSILIALSYLLMLNASISISTLKKQNKNLIQELGLLTLRLEQLEEKVKNTNSEEGDLK